jgi:hypothetical protein
MGNEREEGDSECAVSSGRGWVQLRHFAVEGKGSLKEGTEMALKKKMQEQILPVWANMKTIRTLTGVCDKTLYSLAIGGKVDMRKLGNERRSAAVFRVQDVLEWIEGCRNSMLGKRAVGAEFEAGDYDEGEA